MKKASIAAVVGLSTAFLLCAATLPQTVQSQEILTPYASVLKGERNFLAGYDPRNADGTYNVVIEIPAGTTAKYGVNRATGLMELEQKNGEPSFVEYLGYPANYGFIPHTTTAKNDSLKVLVLGPAMPRGSVVKGRLIGVLSVTDATGTKDQAIIVTDNTPFADLRSVADLDAKFPGAKAILQTWFANFNGAAATTGFKGRAEAIPLVGGAILAYESAMVTDADKRPLDAKGNPQLYRWPGAKNVGE
jgi:inorganic pyrophosphatase